MCADMVVTGRFNLANCSVVRVSLTKQGVASAEGMINDVDGLEIGVGAAQDDSDMIERVEGVAATDHVFVGAAW